MTIMNKEEKLMMLFDIQEHPERYTDEQIENLLADEEVKDYFKELALARMAGRKAKPSQVDVDEAWQKFSRQHFPDEAESASGTAVRKSPHFRRMKIAVSIVGVIFLSGVAWATAIHQGWVKGFSSSEESSHINKVEHTSASTSLSADSVKVTAMEMKKDSTDLKPVVFDNAELKDVLTLFASFYQVKVEYQNEEAQHVRLFFNWDKQRSLQQNIEILNAFDRINISYENGCLKVK